MTSREALYNKKRKPVSYGFRSYIYDIPEPKPRLDDEPIFAMMIPKGRPTVATKTKGMRLVVRATKEYLDELEDWSNNHTWVEDSKKEVL